MRSFVAVNFSDQVRRDCWESIAPVREQFEEVKWVRSGNIHLTVKFLGEIDDETADAIGAKLDSVVSNHRQFDVSLGQFGVFPSPSRPRVFWIGCDGGSALELLYHDIEKGLEELGVEGDSKPFKPHLTLGRARKGADRSKLRSAAEFIRDNEFAAVDLVTSADLMASILKPAGAEYNVIHSARLGG